MFRYLLFSAAAIMFSGDLLAQSNVIVIQQVIAASHRKTKGFAITSGNDTLKGYFSLNQPKGVVFQSEKSDSSNPNRDSSLQKSSFKSVFLKLNPKGFHSVDGFSEYNFFPEFDKILRKIFSDRNDYYDENLNNEQTAWKTAGDIFIVQKGSNIIRISTRDKSTFKSLVDYLNKTWRANYSNKDFKTSIDVIREIDKRLQAN